MNRNIQKSFADKIAVLGNLLKADLPGSEAQFKMAPLNRRGKRGSITEYENYKRSAVMILLYPVGELINTVLIVRANNSGIHSGQIGFPGGSFEEGDGTLTNTALRETAEEIGINREKIKILGKLTDLHIPVSGFQVFPVVGSCDHQPHFKKQDDEVHEILHVNVHSFLSPGSRTNARVKSPDDKDLDVPAYIIGARQIIWGATAMIISEFSEIMGHPLLGFQDV